MTAKSNDQATSRKLRLGDKSFKRDSVALLWSLELEDIGTEQEHKIVLPEFEDIRPNPDEVPMPVQLENVGPSWEGLLEGLG